MRPEHPSPQYGSDETLAICGMGVISDRSESIDDFERSVLNGLPIQLKNYQLPHENDQAARSENYSPDALAVRTAIRTLQHAGLSPLAWKNQPIALICFDDHLPAERIRNTLQLTGPLLQLSSTEALARGLKQAHAWLKENSSQAALLLSPGSALLLMRQAEALHRQQTIYALIEAIGAAVSPSFLQKLEPILSPAKPFASGDLASDTHAAMLACHHAFEQTVFPPQTVTYLEIGAADQKMPEAETSAILSKIYNIPQAQFTCAAGYLEIDQIRHTAAADICRLIKTTLGLYRRTIPATPLYEDFQTGSEAEASVFYFPENSRTWFCSPAQPKRIAAVHLERRAGECTHILLSEAHHAGNSCSHLVAESIFLLLLAAPSSAVLLNRMEEALRCLQQGTPLTQMVWQESRRFQNESHFPFKAALLSHNKAELSHEIELAHSSMNASLEKKGEWQTPGGSYAAAHPLGRQAEIAFVYPGAFNSFIGAGRELFRLFPRLHEDLAKITSDGGRILRERLLYPRSRRPLSPKAIQELEKNLKADAIAMLTSGTGLSYLYTHLLKEIFDIRPGFAFGYSLGENSMMFANGVWQNGDEVNTALENSPLFHTRLAGKQDAIREYWGLAPDLHTPTPLWSNYVVMVSPETIGPSLNAARRVYLTHINAPRQVVIAGKREDCRQVIEELGNPMHLQAPFDYALHCEAMRSEQSSLTMLHSWPLVRQPDLRMYTADGCRPLPFERQAIAESMGRMLCTCVNFPHLVQQVYEDGARVFIECGAGANCARWIDDTLKGKPHLSLSVNRQGQDDLTSIMRLLATLACHDIPFDLASLFLPHT